MHVGEALSLLEKAAKKQEQVHDILIGAQRLEMNSNSSSSAPGAEERPLPNLSAALGDVYGKLEETVLTSGPGTGQMENENATKDRGDLHGHLSTARTRVVAENVHYLLNAMTVAFVSRLLELVDVPLDFSVRSLIDDEAEATGAWLLGTTEDGKAGGTVQQHPHAHRILQGLVASAAGAASRGQHQQRLEFPHRNGDSSWSKLERARSFLQGLEDLQREAEDVAETHAGHEQPHDVHELYLALADFEHRQEAVRRKHSLAMRAFWSQYGERILVNARRLLFGLQDDEFLRVLDAKFEGFADEVEDATMSKRRKLGEDRFFSPALFSAARAKSTKPSNDMKSCGTSDWSGARSLGAALRDGRPHTDVAAITKRRRRGGVFILGLATAISFNTCCGVSGDRPEVASARYLGCEKYRQPRQYEYKGALHYTLRTTDSFRAIIFCVLLPSVRCVVRGGLRYACE
eukprot:g16375.t1